MSLRVAKPFAIGRATSLNPRFKQYGFTLVEVLVALGVAAITLTASLKATGSMVNSNEALRQRLVATWSAENRMAQIRLEKQWPDIGNTQFSCDQANFKLQCKQKITAMPYKEIRGVELEVFAEDGHRVARLVGFAKSGQ
jgi:general secretion pathway protein I